MDALKSNALNDQPCDADGDLDIFRDSDSDADAENDPVRGSHRYPPPAYDKAAHSSKVNGAGKESLPSLLAPNFYKVLSPAHRIERDLELYLSQKCPTPINLKLQVKIIFDKPKETYQPVSSSTAATTVTAATVTAATATAATAATATTAATAATAVAAATPATAFTSATAATAVTAASAGAGAAVAPSDLQANGKTDNSNAEVDKSSDKRVLGNHHDDACDDDRLSDGEEDVIDDGGGDQLPHTMDLDLADHGPVSDGTHIDVDTDLPNAVAPVEDEEAVAKRNAEALKDLLESVSKSILVRKSRLSARNIKVQENNDLRTYSTSFITLPTLNPRTLALEALSVVSMGPAQIREEAWKQLRALQFTANLKKNNPKKKS
jgi:hypothetical protein